ncbi:hypothetical protein N806_31160 [Rhodococcus sp. P27]|nr:hypothetical protein N806_31160 [Rhodococcus sp. P27]
MIPTQSQADMDDPEEHVVWALVHLPNVGGVVQVTHPMILRAWSKHLVECGFVWAPGLAELADENGMIHVSQLPAQQIKHQPAPRGPRHQYNNAADWVPMDTPEPKKAVIPDIRALTPEENAAMLAQYKAAG